MTVCDVTDVTMAVDIHMDGCMGENQSKGVRSEAESEKYGAIFGGGPFAGDSVVSRN